MRILVEAILVTTLLSVASVARADLQQGIDAYDRKDYATALTELTPLAEQGNARAQNLLGVMYERGSGVPQDYPQAVAWYRKSAEQSNSEAEFNLGVMYANGRGVPQDHGTAALWFRKAADVGNGSAQLNLGVMYEQGLGLPRNYGTAMSWYCKAADQGVSGAQNAIGALYGKGLGVPVDYRAAMDWYLKAAAQGHVTAQNNLGFMFLNGQGTETDLVLAYAWFTLASAAGNEDARSNKQLAASKMNPEQVASGEQLAQGGPARLATEAQRSPPAPPCRATTADAHPDIKWVDDLSCLLEGNVDTSTVEVGTYMTSGHYEFLRECSDGNDVLRVFRDKGRNRLHLGSGQMIERYSYIVIRSSSKPNGYLFHEVSEKAYRSRSIKACRAP